MTPAAATVFTLQPATPADIPVLRELAHRIWHACYPAILSREQIDYMLARMYDAAIIRAELAAAVSWELACHDGAPAGFISCAFDTATRRVKLHKLYLLPELHGRGFGPQMLDHVKARALALGAREIVLRVNKRNSRAVRAYERAGFHTRETAVADIGGGFVMDDFIMALELTEEVKR